MYYREPVEVYLVDLHFFMVADVDAVYSTAANIDFMLT